MMILSKKIVERETMVSEKIQLRNTEIQLSDDHILLMDVAPNAEVILQDGREIIAAISHMTGGKPCPLFVDSGSITSVDWETRKLLSRTNIVTAVALYVESPLSKVIGNFFVGLNKTIVPFKMFTSKTQALEWLKTF